MLMAIGESAKKMQSDFSFMLLTALKPVLEKAGNPDFCEVGVRTLQRMTDALKLTSVSQLLEDNADYFAPQLSFQLQNILRYPRAIDLLRALLMLSDIRMDHWLERMVQHALKGLDKSHSLRALPYIQVLELYSKAAYNTRHAGPACAKPLAKCDALTREEIARRVADYKAEQSAWLKINETLMKDDDKVDENVEECEELEPEPEEEPQKEEAPPPQVTLVGNILDRCIQLLPQSTEEQLYVSLMKTIGLSIEVLSLHEDIFLPKVHQLWEPLKNQLFGTSHLKQRQALEILLSLIRRCPDFIRHRVVTDALSKLVAFLESQATASRGRSSRAHTASQAYKLQKSTLCAMPTIVEFLDPPILLVGKIVQTISLYLSNQQISELQVKPKLFPCQVWNGSFINNFSFFPQILAKENLIAIAKYHSGSVWLTVQSMIPRRILSLPSNPEMLAFHPIVVNSLILH